MNSTFMQYRNVLLKVRARVLNLKLQLKMQSNPNHPLQWTLAFARSTEPGRYVS